MAQLSGSAGALTLTLAVFNLWSDEDELKCDLVSEGLTLRVIPVSVEFLQVSIKGRRG
jgi:hypothetical protein